MYKPSWLGNPHLLENTAVLVKNSVNLLVSTVRNTMSNIFSINETDINELKDEVWADLSAVYYKYEVEDQKRAFREVAYEIAEKIMDGKWDSIYKKFYRKEHISRQV